MRRQGQELSGFDLRKVQEVFGYLLLHRVQSLPRETLADLLCDECPTGQSKKLLRQALWQLHAALQAATGESDRPVLLVEADWVRVNPAADMALDVAAFEEVFAMTEGIPGEALHAGQAQALRAATDLYQGDLLEGWYRDWCLFERERLKNMCLAMLDKLMGYCQEHEEYETGLLYGERILRYDRASERTHQRLMRLHYLIGDRAAALRQFERCAAALHEELDVRPSRRTAALYEQIRADRLEASPHVPAETAGRPRPAPPPLLDMLARIKQLHLALGETQRQMLQDIQALENALQEGS